MSTPSLPSQYEGEQIILSSGRLILNGRSDSIFLSANQYIHINANEGIYIDIGPKDTDNEANKLYVNAPLIQLGDEKNGNLQAVVKADDLKQVFEKLLLNKIRDFNNKKILLEKLVNIIKTRHGNGVLYHLYDSNYLDEVNKYNNDNKNISEYTPNIMNGGLLNDW